MTGSNAGRGSSSCDPILPAQIAGDPLVLCKDDSRGHGVRGVSAGYGQSALGHCNGDGAFAGRRQPSPGYGTLPLVVSSVRRMPKDQTSDLMVNLPYSAASGAVHLMGNFAPGWRSRVRGCSRPRGAQGCAGLRVPPGPPCNQGQAPARDTTQTPGDQGPVATVPVPPAWARSQQPRARTLPSGVLVVLDEARQAEVGHFAHQVLPNEDVGCPEVPVDVVHPLHVGHAGCNLWGPAHGAPRLAG